jgi:hypothetical protein
MVINPPAQQVRIEKVIPFQALLVQDGFVGRVATLSRPEAGRAGQSHGKCSELDVRRAGWPAPRQSFGLNRPML